MLESEYKPGNKSNIGLVLSDNQLLLPTLLLILLSPPPSSPTILLPLYTMSQYDINLEQVV